jgi:hypothetical protein
VATDEQENPTHDAEDASAPERPADTPGARLAARKAAKAARKAAQRGRSADQVEADALKRATIATDWAHKHRQAILIGIGTLVVAVGAAWAYAHHTQTAARTASDALWAAVETVRSEIRAGGADEATDSSEKSFESASARTEAALEAYRDVEKKHPGTPPAAWAALGVASALFDQGKWAEARAGFEKVISDSGDQDVAIVWAALEGIVFTYEAEENWDGALSKLEELSQSGSGRFKDFADYHAARIHMAKGDATKAKETLRALIDRIRDPENAAKVGQLGSLASAAELRLGELDPSTVSARPSAMPGFGMPGMQGMPGMGGTSEEVQRQIQELLQKMGQEAGGAGGAGAPGAPSAPEGE